MYKYKRVCPNCMTASFNHTDICVEGCIVDSFMTIDDFMDQGGLRNENDELLYRLELLVVQIKGEIEEFDKAWTNTWDTKFDCQVEIPSLNEMVKHSNFVEIP